VRKLDGGEGPEFPSCIDCIARNQLPDGSWGDDAFFLVQDRLINTLACVIALKTWNIHSDKCNKGLSFIHENIKRLPENDENWMLAGFVTIFPTLLEMAKDIGLDIPCDEPALQDIYAKRDLKLAKYDNYFCLFVNIFERHSRFSMPCPAALRAGDVSDLIRGLSWRHCRTTHMRKHIN